jgi:hypothetical protein
LDVLESGAEDISEVCATAVSHKRSDFRRILDEQLEIELSERLSCLLDCRALAIATTQTQQMASLLHCIPLTLSPHLKIGFSHVMSPILPLMAISTGEESIQLVNHKLNW